MFTDRPLFRSLDAPQPAPAADIEHGRRGDVELVHGYAERDALEEHTRPVIAIHFAMGKRVRTRTRIGEGVGLN